jgi:hypothetical protein
LTVVATKSNRLCWSGQESIHEFISVLTDVAAAIQFISEISKFQKMSVLPIKSSDEIRKKGLTQAY